MKRTIVGAAAALGASLALFHAASAQVPPRGANSTSAAIDWTATNAEDSLYEYLQFQWEVLGATAFGKH